MKVKKVFNNNVVLAIDEQGIETIVMGKGIGFKKFSGDAIDITLIEKRFVFQDKGQMNSFYDLLTNIPIQSIELASEIVEAARKELPFTFNDSVIITLSDHLNYMVQRVKDGFFFNNPLQWEIQSIYPDEYAFGKKTLAMIETATSLSIPESESAFIALHFANAHLENKSMEETLLLTKIINNVMDIIRYYYKIEIEETSSEYIRFIAHLKYFVKRQLKNEQLNSDTALLSIMEIKCADDYKCAQKIGKFLTQTYQWKISNDELLYLTLHLNRIANARR